MSAVSLVSFQSQQLWSLEASGRILCFIVLESSFLVVAARLIFHSGEEVACSIHALPQPIQALRSPFEVRKPSSIWMKLPLIFRSGEVVSRSVRNDQGSVCGVPPHITKMPQSIQALHPPATVAHPKGGLEGLKPPPPNLGSSYKTVGLLLSSSF